jgi:hypothetical protein
MDGFLAVLTVVVGYLVVTAASFGSVLALVMSWSRNHSVFWAVVHGWLGWFYVVYYCVRRHSKVL